MIKLSKNEKLVLTILSSFLVLTIPILIRIRTGNIKPIGFENFTLMNTIISNNIANFTPYLFFLKSINSFIELDLIIKVMPVFLGVVNSVILFILLDKLKIQRNIRDYSVILYILSPIFIFAFTLHQNTVFALTLMLCGIYLLLQKQKIINILAYLCLIPVLFFGAFEGLFLVLILVIIQKTKRTTIKQKDKLLLSIKLISIVFLVTNLFVQISFNKNLSDAFPGFNTNLIFDFSGMIGIGFFTLILLVISFAILYSKKDKYRNELTIFIITLFLLLINTKKGLILTLPLLSYLAGIGAAKIIDRKWIIANLKYFTAITLIYGILFSSVSAIVIIANESPNNEMIQTLNMLKTQPNGLVLTTATLEPYLTNIAKKEIFKSSTIATKIYKNYKVDNLDLISSSHIQYILITGDMKKDIWHNEQEGLLILVQDTDNFKSIYKTDNVDLYKFKYKRQKE